MWGLSDGHAVSITVLFGKSSFRSPQSTRLHPTKPYFCFCPCVESGFIIDQQHPHVGQYRVLMTDAKTGVQWLQQRWQEFTSRSGLVPCLLGREGWNEKLSLEPVGYSHAKPIQSRAEGTEPWHFLLRVQSLGSRDTDSDSLLLSVLSPCDGLHPPSRAFRHA